MVYTSEILTPSGETRDGLNIFVKCRFCLLDLQLNNEFKVVTFSSDDHVVHLLKIILKAKNRAKESISNGASPAADDCGP